jgi:hypothetical protein
MASAVAPMISTPFLPAGCSGGALASAFLPTGEAQSRVARSNFVPVILQGFGVSATRWEKFLRLRGGREGVLSQCLVESADLTGVHAVWLIFRSCRRHCSSNGINSRVIDCLRGSQGMAARGRRLWMAGVARGGGSASRA